jgi:16S rRNA (guanine966-N2)-methyltransferase
VRVIAGRLRGRTIHAPPSDVVRPTYDRVRESLFGILEPLLPGAAVLDLFAGSGSLGIESVSRGARSVTFVERDASVLRVTGRNIAELGLTEQCRRVRGDAIALVTGRLPGGPFDVVFVDPPYGSGLARRALEELAESALLAEDALIVVEHAARDNLPEFVGTLSKVRSKRYGTTAVEFYEVRSVPGREEQT